MTGSAEFAAPIMMLVMALLGLAAITGIALFYRRLQRQRDAERAAEMRMDAEIRAMEMQALRDAGSLQAVSASAAPHQTADVADAASLALIAENTSPSVYRAEAGYEPVLEQLRRANLVDTIEGYFDLHGNLKAGVIVRLRDKRRVLILGQFETEGFAQHNLRRFDLVIFVCRDGRGIVLSPLEAMIADSVTSALGRAF